MNSRILLFADYEKIAHIPRSTAHATLSANTPRDWPKTSPRAATRRERTRGARLPLANAASDSERQIAGCAIDRARAGRERTYPPQLHATHGRAECIGLKEQGSKGSAKNNADFANKVRSSKYASTAFSTSKTVSAVNDQLRGGIGTA